MGRAEIESYLRIKEYEAKITDLESETDRLSQSLDSQKAAAEQAQAVASKRIDELGREVQKKVWSDGLLDQLTALTGFL